MKERARYVLVALGCVLSQAACSLVLSTSEQQCETDADCTARGDAFEQTICSKQKTCVSGSRASSSSGGTTDPRFACANEAPPSADGDREVSLEVRYIDFSTGAAPADVSARLCASTDPTCANARDSLEGEPSDAGTGYVEPTGAGVVTAKVEYGFEGFLEVATGTYSPTFRYTSPPLRESETFFEQIVLRPAEIDYFAEILTDNGSYLSEDHALVFVLAQDCARQPLSGVHFTADVEDDAMVPFYIVNTAPTRGVSKTDALGRAGFLNVPEGIVTFTAEMDDTGERIGSATILVRAGAATTVAVLPSP